MSSFLSISKKKVSQWLGLWIMLSASVATYAQTPAAPSGLTATAISTTQVNLTWTDASTNETGFQVERSTTSGTGFLLVNTRVANATSFSNTGFTASTQYFYRIRSINGSGGSAYTAEVSVSTSRPQTPTGLLASVASTSQINLSWTDASTTETGFRIERSTTSGTGFTLVTNVAANVTSFSNTGLSSNTTYYYRIRAFNGSINSSFTAQVTTTTSAPAAPTNLVAIAASATQINLTWVDAASNETGFQLESSTTAGTGFVQIATLGVNNTSFNNTALVANTTYYYRIRAVNGAGNSLYSAEVSASTSIPLVPVSVTTTASSSTRVNLTWTDASNNETGFQIERSTTSGSGFLLVSTTAANAVSFSNSALTANTTYYYRMRAINAVGNSAYTAESVVSTSTPAAPTVLVATVASITQINLTWTDASTSETGFQIERSNTSGAGFVLIATTAANETSFSSAGLVANTVYFYRIRAVNGSLRSGYTSQVTSSTSLPLTPTGLRATAASTTQINLSWTDASNNETGFQIERSTTSGSGFSLLTTTAANAVSFSNTGLIANTTYFYRISATNALGNSVYTPERSISTAIPSIPNNLVATTASTTQVNLAWVDASNNETGFRIERSLTAGTGFALVTTTAANITSLSNNTGLIAGTRYFYRIRSTNAIGSSAFTTEVNAVTNLVAPTALTAAAISTTQINLVWADGSTNETGFQIERSLTITTGFSLLATTSANTTSYSDVTGSPGTNYFYRIRSINNAGAGISVYAAEANATTAEIGVVPDIVEFNALKDLFNNTNGANWTNKTNWPTTWPASATAAQMGTWFGVTVANGDITGISLCPNNLVGQIPESIGALRQLDYFALCKNLGLAGTIPASMTTIDKLKSVYLSECNLTGTISPDFFRASSSLTVFAISYNKLTGTIPTNIGDARGLYLVNLGYNQLSGTIPSSVYSLNLRLLDLQFNQLTGTISSQIGDFQRLEGLHLNNNQLTGGIPTQIGNIGGNRLLRLTLQSNLLVGSIPAGIANLTSLQHLRLDNNQLTGGIPSGIGSLTGLVVLNLESNQLTGNLPIAFADASILQTFRVGGNQLSGPIPANYFSGWNKLTTLSIAGNNFSFFPILAGNTNKANLALSVETNLLDFSSIIPNLNQGLQSFTFTPQKLINDVTSINYSNSSLLITPRPTDANTTVIWEKQDASTNWQNINTQNQDATQKTFKKATASESDAGVYRWTMTNSSVPDLTLQSTPINVSYAPSINDLVKIDSTTAVVIPQQVKITREGLIPTSVPAPQYQLSELNKDDSKNVLPAPPCLVGNYYVGFQLYYDLADKQTTQDWLGQLTITLLQGSNTIWSSPLQVNTKNQTFISTAFYDKLISCDSTYRFRIDQKLLVGQVPQSNVSLRVLLYKDFDDVFVPSATLDLSCNYTGSATNLGWSYSGKAAIDYDVEWVFIADHENYTTGDPFKFKEPVRVTIATINYTNLLYYQKGKVWYRARAVGYNPRYPDHRILGNWFNSNCSPLIINNPEPQKNWQVQTVFAEEGKYKKVVHYFDGTLRTRQSQTNLSTDSITLSGETLYDFEGRKSVEILAAPSETNYNSSLTFKPGLNNFQASDGLVVANTSDARKKYHYDNQLAINSTLSTADGAGRYYSSANVRPTVAVHRMLIPNGEGFVYSQTEYLNDGTGRVKRQSGVGKDFRMDGDHATRYYYGSAAPAELIRLFGRNVGNASHYKKNLVVDANGQVSVSYHDQSDRVIATALAGEKPENLTPLPSFSALSTSAVNVDITSVNQRKEGVSTTTHKILNTSPNTSYQISYDIIVSNPSFGELGCPNCKLDLSITVTNPEGKLMNLGAIVGNESADQFSYVRKGLSGLLCAPQNSTVQIDLNLPEIGDYTITKTLVSSQLSFEEIKSLVIGKASVQAKIQQLRDSYVPDASQCAVCQTNDCTDTEKDISDAINKVASLDCENIKNSIIEKLIENNPNVSNYYPTEAEIKSDVDFCRYLLCVQDMASDVFEKQLSRPANWTAAVQKGYQAAVDLDPFFKEKGLSGYGYKSNMVNRLDNIVIGDINANLRTPRPIQEVLNPLNPFYYIDDQGNPTNSTSIGYHVLYYELMKQNPPDYVAQLDNQRWSLFRGFYLEAKRKTKLNMPAYSTDCARAKEELERTDKLPLTEDGVNNWADGIKLKAVTDEQINMIYYLLTISCNPTVPLNFSPQDASDIKTNLRIYLTNSANNFYGLILKNDLAIDGNNQIINISLRAIDTILKKYSGCESALSSAAVDDPLVCQTYKTINFPIPAQLPNLVVNPGVNPTPTCTPFITNNGCYDGWSAQSGAPQVVEPGVIQLSGQRCNIDSKAVGGSITLPGGLVPGKKYKFSVTYRALTQNDKVYCEFFNNDGYRRADGSIFKLGESILPVIQPCPAQSPSFNSNSQDSNILPNVIFNPCPDPGAVRPSPVLVNGVTTNNVWMKESVPLASSPQQWATDEIIFTATENSTNFVFTTIPNTGNRLDGDGNNLTTWGTNGTFSNGNDGSIPEMFSGTNTSGTIQSASYRTSAPSLSIVNTAGPQAKGGMLLRFNAIAGRMQASKFYIEAWVRTPASSISSNPNALLYITTPHPDWEIVEQNLVPFCNTIGFSWTQLYLTIARRPGVGAVPLPDFFSISTTMKDSEALLNTGSLLVDDIKVFDGKIYNTGATQSIDIKDVIIKEQYDSTRTFCIEYQAPPVLDYIALYKAACMENEVKIKGILAQLAVDKLLETEVSTFSNTYLAQCLEGAKENLKYTFTPKEYHYTLYYYDQAGNLAQTVPPEGVKPLTMGQVNAFPATPDPAHKLITRYQYSSLNQLLYQITPDAGESRFWYNEKSQLKLSQNARQLIDKNYSYNKYDEQGRVTEVGEMATTDPVLTLTTQLENSDFPKPQNLQAPSPNTYLLTDITRTHYDFAGPTPIVPQWTNTLNVVVNGNTLTNTGGAYWEDHAFSVNYIPANSDGYLEFKSGSAATEFVMGLSTTDNDTYYTINYGVLAQGGSLYVVENNNGGAPKTTYSISDVFRIERKGGTVSFLKNGIVFYTSAISSVGALYADCNFNNANNLVTNISMGFSLPSGITGNVAIPTFTQQQLRNRVAWVEVLDKNRTDVTATYYSYDIHGNVKSLVQQVPGIANKRTDYVYDLVSGKVNFVMYEYAQRDQFIHQYVYDADNRITNVKSSSDGFLWDKDATYRYYLHGPLARVVLGQYTVQGLDYYYTLQGWLKGVNSPTGASAQVNDPSKDGNGTSMVARDVYAYNLGYYQGDYKPIGPSANSALIENSSPLLWTGAGGEVLDLFNGNIAWMATDLGMIGRINKNRNTGVQAMQYNYDQLNRIARSRSLGSYNESTGLAARSAAPAAYDEDYTYDANGNILTLQRRDQLAALKDNFTYTYIKGTNQLRGVKPVAEDKLYEGPIVDDSKLYRNITVRGNASVPDGADVVLRATENIYVHPQFKKANGKSFHAYIAEDGPYHYDAIGNLILNEDEGTSISWTPYGKVREVKTKGDSVTVSYRYDAAGNRTEKRVSTLTENGNTTAIATNYLRDASGNVMAIYTRSPLSLVEGAGLPAGQAGGEVLTEQPLYGSSRLGQYTGGRKEGQRRLGYKNYELSNHLGNVLSVITDNIGMKPDSVWATVVSATDYYPFGLEMKGRTYNNEKYRYGFNGKEKDGELKGEGNSLDFGLRIYDPRIGRWLSVDPKAHLAPHESPYCAMGNNPIYYIDPDGQFKIPIHKRITENAFKNSGLSSGWRNFFKNDVKLGVSVEADILGAASDYHFDGRKNYSAVQSTWKGLNSDISNKIDDLGSFNRSMGGDDAVLFGRMIHTVQDFYSHSNYVELYIDYYKGANEGAMPTSVPIYDVANGGTTNADFNAVLQKNLRTGDFDIIDNEITNPNGKKAQQPTSHNKMNKDKANTLAGRLAEKVATEHTTQILKQVKEKE